MKKRLLSFVLCLAMLFGLVAMGFVPMATPVHAATASQNNIVARANYLYNATWVCQKTVAGWRGNYTFYKGTTYHIPYGQPVYAGAYVGFGVSVDDYLAAAADANSVFYTSQSNYAGKTSTYYATDCSAYVSWCWGTSRHTTASIPNISTYIGSASLSNIKNYLQLGDCLNSNSAGHVVLVTGLTYDSSGALTQIEITEQTPPQLKRSYYTPSSLASKYSGSYSIYRYTGTVPAAPGGSSSATTSFGTKVSAKLKNWVFNAAYYREKYDDLTSMTDAQLYDHYLNYGITEGRQASALFNVKYYLNQNNELKEAFGTDYEAAFNHFVEYGQYEASRVYSKQLTNIRDEIFDADFYCTMYPDDTASFGGDVGKLFANFIKTGLSKGYTASPVFDISYYISANADLTAVYKDDYYGAIHHFISSGQKESRQVSPILNVEYYVTHYDDVASLTCLEAMNHFLNTGLGEVRQGSENFLAEFYYFAHSSAREGYTESNCYLHYLLSGYKDGKRAAPYAEFPQEYANLGAGFTARMTNVKSGLNWSISDTDVIIYTPSESDAQKWKFVRQTDGSYEITNVKYGTVLTATDNGSADGLVVIAEDVDGINQRWYLYEVDGYYCLRTACNKWISIGLTSGDTTSGNTVEMAYFRGNDAQKYTVTILSVDIVECTTHSYVSNVTTAPTCTEPGTATYTCSACGHSYTETVAAAGHSYENGTCLNCGTADPDYIAPAVAPTLAAAGFSLSFENEILVNFYYTVSDMTHVTEQGMLVFGTDPGTADIAAADAVYPGSSANGSYIATTDGIAAKEMGDDRYYCAYAKLTDGTIAYSALYQYSPRKYAMNMLGKDSTSDKQKALCVAMLNYGAAAQTYFGYKTDDLMNAALTDEQKALVVAYDSTLFKGAVAADSAKTGAFTATASGFSSKSATVSFEGAFAINYYFAPSTAVAGEMKLYIWNPETYASAAQLTADNASGVVSMEAQASGAYWGQVEGIAAKALDDTYYVAGVYEDGSGNTYCTGVVAYSLSRYCINNAKEGKDMQHLAANTAMYGYYAKCYFAG